jgi:DNA-binding XRE family transcriptional regulator
LGWAQKTLAKRVGVSLKTVSLVENLGRTSRDTAERIASALGLPIEDILVAGGQQRSMVWFLGSYTDQTEVQRRRTTALINRLGSQLVRLDVRVVMGKSAMLQDLADAYLKAMPGDTFVPCAVMLYGRLRQWDVRDIFRTAIGAAPDLGVVLGGDVSKGRVKQEYDAAVDAGIPMIPVKSTGGQAADLRLTASRLNEAEAAYVQKTHGVDVGRLADTLIQSIRRYAPSRGHRLPDGGFAR